MRCLKQTVFDSFLEKSRHERVVREMNKDLDGAIAGFLEDNNIAGGINVSLASRLRV